MTAIDVISGIVPGRKLHAVGYCLGGTILAIAAAAMDRDHDDRLASLSLLAAQTDFEEAGELMLFIDESQLALLEDIMHVQGFLETRQMAGAFYVLRANEMIFAQFVERYLLGEPRAPSDLDAWLADPTRMPARMHSEYLRQLFLDNSFAHGKYLVDGRAVALKDIKTSVFALGAERDHIAPWRSVYNIELYSSADTEFVLTGGGHNSSVVSPPGKAGAYYRVSTCDPSDKYVDPDTWLASASQKQGSWWPEWIRWLDAHSSSVRVTPSFLSNTDGGLPPMVRHLGHMSFRPDTPTEPPRIVPYGADQTVYVVIDSNPGLGTVYRETEIERTDLETIIADLMSGQFNDPIRVVAFNTLEHWSEDVSEYICFDRDPLRHRRHWCPRTHPRLRHQLYSRW